MDAYQRNGFKNRKEYLESLAKEMGFPREIVFELANILGPNEDFDGLITELEDMGDLEAYC